MPDARGPATTEATLGAFDPPIRHMLVPLLLYKSIFMGEWFDAVAAHDPEPQVASLLRAMARETLGEALSLVTVMREWQEREVDVDRDEQLAARLQNHVLLDLLAIKEGNAEAVLMLAMQAPTDRLRNATMLLAGTDRRHAEELRDVLRGHAAHHELADAARGGPDVLGPKEGRGRHGTLARAVEHEIRGIREGGATPVRVVLSHTAARHLRDEGLIAVDGTLTGLNVDVDFGWQGEGFAVVTSERVSLGSLLTSE